MVHGHELVELAAALVLVGLAGFFVPASWLEMRNARLGIRAARPVSAEMPAEHPGTAADLLPVVAASLALGAGLIHFAAIETHAEFAPFAAAFGLLAVLQLALAAGLLRRPDLVRLPALVLHAGVVGVWLLSRTVGLPVGPHAWLPEPVGTADALATAFALGLVAILLLAPRLHARAYGARASGRDVRRRTFPVALVPVVGVIGLLTLIALASLASAAPHSHA